MAEEYQEVTGEVEVPTNVGIKGFLRAIENILKLPKVQDVHVNAKGLISFRRFARQGEILQPLEVDFETLAPYAVIRNSRVVELSSPNDNAAIALAQLFNMASNEGLWPVALVGGANTTFWWWLEKSTRIPSMYLPPDQAFGLPFLKDRQLEDDVLVLCAAYARSAALIDTQRSYKLVIPVKR